MKLRVTKIFLHKALTLSSTTHLTRQQNNITSTRKGKVFYFSRFIALYVSLSCDCIDIQVDLL
ncbi:CLUMA_CG013583, isoform A [Clunio marinus]|uniref:CLUMA_CG013583, isoform A n=1 Tax=Clunio marinus TaxID=568069 RepID=A0A1J1IMJ7_9DIPT|nr:CLUMA_CG013583, isoform A [Clunio marinus]